MDTKLYKFLGPLLGLALLASACSDSRDLAAPDGTIKPSTAPTTADPDSPSTEAPPTSDAGSPTSEQPTPTTAKPSTSKPPTSKPPTSKPPTTGNSKPVPEGSGCTPAAGSLSDGTWFGLVATADTDSLDFDLACYFTGDAAAKAAKADGAESPPPNDYYVRNENKTLRALSVGSSSTVTWYPQAGDQGSKTKATYAEWLTASADRGFPLAVWVKVSGGSVVSVEELWVP